MKAGWSPELEACVRAVPMTARMMIEAQAVAAGDLRQRKDQWSGADSTTGLELRDDGSVRLAAANQTLAEQTTDSSVHHSNLRRLYGAGPYDVARIDWQDDDPDDLEIRRITARLDPTDDGLDPQEVATWICQLWAVIEILPGTGSAVRQYRAAPLGDAVAVAAGPTDGDVVFDFSARPRLPQPKRVRPIDQTGLVQWPVTLVAIYGITSTGTVAGNIAWMAGGGTQTGNNPISGRRLLDAEVQDLGAFDESATITTPRLKVETGSFSQATLAFTGANPLDLGAAPAAGNLVEFTARAEVPLGAAVTFEVRNDADSAWVPFVDGDTVDDLAGVTAQQTYKVRAILDPDASGGLTPILRGIGVRELTRTDLSDVATLQGGSAGFDPKTFEGQVGNPQLLALRDGEPDFQDAISDLLATNDIGALLFRVWIGADDLPRSQWLHLDDYRLLDDRGLDGAIGIDLVSVLGQLDVDLPRFDTQAGELSLLSYTNTTLKDAYDDLLANQAELPGRHHGPAVEDTSETVSKEITNSTALTELNAIARLSRGAVISSQGRVTFVDVLGKKSVAVIFPHTEIRQGVVTPGWQHRVPDFVVPYDWNPTRNEFDKWFHATDGTGLLLEKLDRAPLTAEQKLPDGTARWITTQSLASRVADDVVQHRATGLILVPISASYAHPELEPGDLVAVETDRFVAKDPLSGRPLRGRLWMLGVIHEMDPWGRELGVLVRSYADIVSAGTDGTGVNLGQDGVPIPQVILQDYTVSNVGDVRADVTLLITDPLDNRAGTLKLWTDHEANSSADPSTTEEGSATVSPGSVGPSQVFNLTGGGTSQLLDAIKIPIGAGSLGSTVSKRIYAEYLSANGRSSGVIAIPLVASPFIINIEGGLENDVVDTAQLVDSAVTTSKIGDLQVTTTKLQDGAVTTVKVGDVQITEQKLASGSVTTTKIGDLQVTTSKLDNLAVSTAKIGDAQVSTQKIGDSQVTTAKIGDLQVSEVKLAGNAVTETKIAPNAVTTPKLIANAVTTAKLAAQAVTANELAASAVVADKIAAGAVVAGKIAASAVGTNELAAASVTAAKISVSQLDAITADVGTLTAGKLQDSTGVRGILLSSTIPGTWTRWLNLADSSKAFLKHEKLSLNWDGTADFSGTVSATDFVATVARFQGVTVFSDTSWGFPALELHPSKIQYVASDLSTLRSWIDFASQLISIGHNDGGLVGRASVAGPGQPRCKAYRTTDQSLTGAAWTTLSFDTEEYDVGAVHDTGTNPSRLTIPSGEGGVWLLLGQVWMTSNPLTNDDVELRILKGGTTEVARQLVNDWAASESSALQVLALETVSGGDYFEVEIYQGSNNSKAAGGSAYETFFAAIKLW